MGGGIEQGVYSKGDVIVGDYGMCTIGEAMTDYYIFCGSHNWISPVAVLDASDIYIPMDLSKSNLSSAVHLHPSAKEEDHILQTALLTRPH